MDDLFDDLNNELRAFNNRLEWHKYVMGEDLGVSLKLAEEEED